MVARWLSQHPSYNLSGTSFEDLGVSGYSGKHLENAFGRLLAAVEEGVIKTGDCVLIEAIDRAGRMEPMDMLPLITKIVRAGVDLHTLDDGITYNSESVNSNHLFMLVAKVQQAYQYSDTLSRRIKHAYERKRATAKAGGHTARRTPVWIDADNKVIPELAPLIRQAFEDYAAGIGERRILTRIRGKHPLLETINPSTIKRWLNNKIAIGYWSNSHLRDRNGKLPDRIPEADDIPDVYPAVVSKELFYRVQRRLNERYKPKSASSRYLLSGLVVCGRCGTNFGVLKHPTSPPSMICMNRHRLGIEHGCSNARSIPYEVLEYIRFITCTTSLLQAMQAQNLSTTEKRLITIDAELSEQHRKSEQLVNMMIDYDDPLPALKNKLKEVAAQISKLEEERVVLQSTESAITFEDAVLHADDLRDENDDLKLNALLQSAGYVITCDDRTITVEHPSLDYSASQQVYKYERACRIRNVYIVNENNLKEVHLPIPNERHRKEVALGFAQFQSITTKQAFQALMDRRQQELRFSRIEVKQAGSPLISLSRPYFTFDSCNGLQSKLRI